MGANGGFFTRSRFKQHPSAQTGEKDERYPMIEGLERLGENKTQGPTEQGHQALSEPKEKAQLKRANHTMVPARSPSQRDGKRVHRETKREKQKR